MDPVKGINQVAQILRQKLSERSPEISKDLSAASSSMHTSGSAAKAEPEKIKRKIGDRIKALSVEDRCGPKAAQIFVEVVMTWEFGENLLHDPAFTELSRDVVKSMTDNPKIWSKLKMLLAELGGD